MKHLPNALTIGRILLTPVLLALLLTDTLWALVGALTLFVLAAISDYLDGMLARSYQVRSRLGQWLDPLADKVLVLGTFIALVVMVPEIVPWWGVALIALRDAVVTGMRSWAESRGRSLRTLGIAKAKTAVQLVFLIGLLAVMIGAKLPGEVGAAGRWLLESWIPFALMLGVVAFTVVTGVVYLLRQEYSSPIKLNG